MDSPIGDSHWKLLDNISIENVNIPFELFKTPENCINTEETKKEKLIRLEEEKQKYNLLADKLEIIDKTLLQKPKQGKGVTVQHVDLKKKLSKVDVEYRALSVELKQLYTSITRTKNKLYIYDNECCYSKKQILKYWQKLGFVIDYDRSMSAFDITNCVINVLNIDREKSSKRMGC